MVVCLVCHVFSEIRKNQRQQQQAKETLFQIVRSQRLSNLFNQLIEPNKTYTKEVNEKYSNLLHTL